MAIRRKRTMTRPSADIAFFPTPDGLDQYLEKTQVMFKKAIDLGIILAPDVGLYSQDLLSLVQFRVYRDEAAMAEMDDLVAQSSRGFPSTVDSETWFEANNIIVSTEIELNYILPETI